MTSTLDALSKPVVCFLVRAEMWHVRELGAPVPLAAASATRIGDFGKRRPALDMPGAPRLRSLCGGRPEPGSGMPAGAPSP